MKRFHQLTKPQQDQAIAYAKGEVEKLFEGGVVQADRLVTDDHVNEMAVAMAEDALYSERTDMIVADIADGK